MVGSDIISRSSKVSDAGSTAWVVDLHYFCGNFSHCLSGQYTNVEWLLLLQLLQESSDSVLAFLLDLLVVELVKSLSPYHTVSSSVFVCLSCSVTTLESITFGSRCCDVVGITDLSWRYH